MTRRPAADRRLRIAGLVCAVTACAAGPPAGAAAADPDPAVALRARYVALSPQLEQSLVKPHLYVESAEGRRAAHGDVYAVVNYPIGAVSDAFSSPRHWCDALILHLNVKYCRYVVRGKRPALAVALGRKSDQPLENAYRIEFAYSAAPARPDYMHAELNASKGPLGTGDYRIVLEAVGLEQDRAFAHLRYSYTYGLEARIAMQAYLATAGSSKVGFTQIREPNDPQPKFVGGARGAIERNTVRYYLAIDAYLAALTAPAAERFEQSLERWFSATERYPRQLHEVDRSTYLEMKRREYQRQQTVE
jgi:hypothetical protein